VIRPPAHAARDLLLLPAPLHSSPLYVWHTRLNLHAKRNGPCAGQASAAVTIASPGPGRAQTLEYSQSLNERNTFYFNRCTAGPSSGPADPTMLPPVLELPPPSMEASAGSSPPPRLSTLSASAPASTAPVGRWVLPSPGPYGARLLLSRRMGHCLTMLCV
jgi:hypothetical protein